ncbi:MAG: hypothetical protein Q9160_001530 [Pyrenula sp. 1 TL-2023]
MIWLISENDLNGEMNVESWFEFDVWKSGGGQNSGCVDAKSAAGIPPESVIVTSRTCDEQRCRNHQEVLLATDLSAYLCWEKNRVVKRLYRFVENANLRNRPTSPGSGFLSQNPLEIDDCDLGKDFGFDVVS